MSDKKGLSIPRRLPLLLVGDAVLLPGASMRIPVNNPTNMNMVKSHILRHNTLTSTVIGVVPKNPEKEEVLDSMHAIGTAGVVVQVTGTNWPRPAYTLLVTGLCRFKVNRLLQEEPYPVAQVEQLDKLPGDVAVLEADAETLPVADDFREQATRLLELLDITTPVVAKLKSPASRSVSAIQVLMVTLLKYFDLPKVTK
eukprot:XP_011668983.1 PREDICTED: lon protease homolog 2, peroxisomal [Strongylocentrotus purpuratus]